MQICYNCGRTFDDDEIVQQRDGETGLHIYCCPHCGVDDIGEAEVCTECGNGFAEGETASGICLHCLWDAIDYDVALAYMKEAGTLADFMIQDWFGAGRLEHSSVELDQFFEQEFKRLEAKEKVVVNCFNEPADFLVHCRYFCLPKFDKEDLGCDGRSFAEWYVDWREKNK